MKIKRKIGKLLNYLLGRFGVAIHTTREQAPPKEELGRDNVFRDIFLSPWTDLWKEYYVRNFNSIDSDLEKLKVGMDLESKKVVDTMWEKIIFQIPYNKYKKSLLYKYDDFFTKEEIDEQKREVALGKYKLPNNVNIEPSVFLSKNGLVYLDDDITSKIRNRAVIDGGAYIGDSAIVFCQYEPSKIYSFEPIDSLRQKMRETLRLNGAQKMVEPVKFGLSDKAKEVKIFGQDSAASIYTSEKDTFQMIKTISIDNFVKDRKIDVGLIKLDIEGSELEAIQGALETIRSHKPILLISVYHRPEDFFHIKPLIESLNLGYKFILRKTSPFRVTSETLLIGYVDTKTLDKNNRI